LKLAFVELDGVFVSKIEGVGDEGMANGDFIESLDMAGKILEVVEVEVVTGVEAEAEFDCAFGCRLVGGDGFFTVGMKFVGIGLGVKFDAVGAGGGGTFYHGDDGIDEEGNADTGLLENADDAGEVVFVPDGVPAVVGGYLPEGVRNEGHLGRAYIQYEIDEFLFLGVAFYIEFGGDALFDGIHVCITDVTFVWPGMDGDSIGAEQLGIYGCLNYVGIIASPAVAQGCEFVDVYRKFRHWIEVKLGERAKVEHAKP
jgi:hypothetical protein